MKYFYSKWKSIFKLIFWDFFGWRFSLSCSVPYPPLWKCPSFLILISDIVCHYSPPPLPTPTPYTHLHTNRWNPLPWQGLTLSVWQLLTLSMCCLIQRSSPPGWAMKQLDLKWHPLCSNSVSFTHYIIYHTTFLVTYVKVIIATLKFSKVVTYMYL